MGCWTFLSGLLNPIFMDKQFRIKEFMVEKSGVEKSLKNGVKKPGVAMFSMILTSYWFALDQYCQPAQKQPKS